MLQALAALFGAAFTVAACYAAGMLLLQRLGTTLSPPEKFPLGFVLGAACLHLVLFAVLALKLANWPVLVGLLAIVALVLWYRHSNPEPEGRIAIGALEVGRANASASEIH